MDPPAEQAPLWHAWPTWLQSVHVELPVPHAVSTLPLLQAPVASQQPLHVPMAHDPVAVDPLDEPEGTPEDAPPASVPESTPPPSPRLSPNGEYPPPPPHEALQTRSPAVARADARAQSLAMRMLTSSIEDDQRLGGARRAFAAGGVVVHETALRLNQRVAPILRAMRQRLPAQSWFGR